MLTIAQISDIHIGGTDENCYGIDTRKNFEKVLNSVSQDVSIDLIILTGDIAFKEPSAEIFIWAKNMLDRVKIPYYVQKGNHDISPFFEQVFGANIINDEILDSLSTDYFNFLSLDTSSGSVPVSQIERARALYSCNKTNVVFLHHPPLLANVVYMDRKYSLQNRSLLLDCFSSKTQNLFFCGHYHCEKTVIQGNNFVFVCPSTFFQIDQNASSFKIESYRIGYRKISFDENVFSSTVVYIG